MSDLSCLSPCESQQYATQIKSEVAFRSNWAVLYDIFKAWANVSWVFLIVSQLSSLKIMSHFVLVYKIKYQ